MVRLITPLLLLVFGITISFYSYQTYGDFNEYGAAFYPTIIGGLVAVFGFVDFVMEMKIKGKYVFQHFNSVQDSKALLLIVAVVLFYLFVSEIAGFVITTATVLLALTLPLIKSRKIFTALFLIALSYGIYLLFAQVLMVSLPSGTLLD